MSAPVIVNLGMGVDSVAMLVGLHGRGERPDYVMFADTGSEKPETYEYLDIINPWLAAARFPLVTVVRRAVGPKGYTSLEGNCLANETLPSLAFRRKSCSLKWKAEAMDAYLLGRKRGRNKAPARPLIAIAQSEGVKPIKLIGYDAGPRDMRRANHITSDAHFVYRYPLQEWGWDRERCVTMIALAGLPIPIKSACFFCPASQPWELLWLAGRHPELFLRSIAMEDRARTGKHGLRAIAGLWGKDTAKHPGSWRRWAEEQGFLRGDQIVMPAEELLARAAALKPAYESNACNGTYDGGLYQLEARRRA